MSLSMIRVPLFPVNLAFQLATSVLFQNPVQNFALTPDNLTDSPAEAIEFMKEVPTTWDDVKLIDGYPGKYVVLARRHGDKWYVAGVNAGPDTRKIILPKFTGNKGTLIIDKDTMKLQTPVRRVVPALLLRCRRRLSTVPPYSMIPVALRINGWSVALNASMSQWCWSNTRFSDASTASLPT